MLPISSSSSTHMEPSWKTYYDAKKLLRQTEQRLKETRDYYPHIHLNSHHETNDLSNLSSSASSSIHAGSRSIFADERLTNAKHQLLDSEALQTIRRKINKQKLAAERRAEQLFHSQSDAGHMFETYRSHSNYATSASLQNLHYSPHRQTTRYSPPKPTTTTTFPSQLSQSQSFPSELDNVLRHSTSAKILTSRENDIERQLTTKKITKILPKDNYSLSNGRTIQQRSASASSKYHDLPCSSYLSPTNVQRLKHIRRVESAHITSNSTNNFDTWRTEPIVTKPSSILTTDEKLSKKKLSTEIISKRTEKLIKSKRDTSAPKSLAKPKSDDEKKKLQDYIQQKREDVFSKDDGEKLRKERSKKINESMKKSSSITPKDLTEQTRQRLLRLLGPSNDYPFDRSSSSSLSSSSSSSSSNDSVVEIQPSKSHEQFITRSRSEPPPIHNGVLSTTNRHENLLRWAINLTRDCDIVENRFKYFRPDSTQSFEPMISSSIQRDDGNLRYSDQSKARFNSLVERRIYRDRAAAKIQAAYRGYSVRKLLNEKQKHLDNDFNKRPIYYRETQGLTVNQQPIDSTVLRYYENQSTDNLLQTNLSTPIHQKQIPIHSPSSSSSTSTTPIPSPEPQVPLQSERRRSMSPPLPPQMSPDNGRPIQILSQTVKSTVRTEGKSPLIDTIVQQSTRKSPVQQSTAGNRKRRSPSPQTQQMANMHSRHRTSQTSSPPTSSSESILTAREKRVRQKFNSDIELQAYEKRLKDIEKKIRQLVKRAFEIFDEKRSNSPTIGRTNKADESTISEDLSVHRKETEQTKKDSDTSSISTHKQSDVVTSDASDLERRVNVYREQLKAKKVELERLKQRKNKEILRRQEDELKKQIESYDHEIQTLRLQPIQQEQTVPVPSISTNSSSQEKTKSTEPVRRDFQGKQETLDEKESEMRPVETPRDEHDTQHDALSITTYLPIESENEQEHRQENDISIVHLDKNLPIFEKEKEESISSSSSSSSKTSEKSIQTPSPRVSESLSSESLQVPFLPIIEDQPKSSHSSIEERPRSPTPPPIIEQPESSSPSLPPPPTPPIEEVKPILSTTVSTEYDEDFSQESRSPIQIPTKPSGDEIEIESIQEDIEDKYSMHSTDHSSASRSSADEQSEILVLVKKSTSNTPRDSEEKLSELNTIPMKIESNDQHTEREDQINQLTETFLRTFIDEAIDQGKEIENIKIKSSITKEASEWMSDEDLTDEENVKQIPITHEEDVENAIEKFSTQPEFLEQLDTTTNGVNDQEELKLDLSRLEDKALDEPRIESPRKTIIEEPIKPVVSHTREQVIHLCQQALTILYNQNTDFSNRLTINRTIPKSYYETMQEIDNVDIQRNRRAYCRMIFDLCAELLYEMHSPNVRIPKYPEWEKSRLISKRFYRHTKPKHRDEAEQFILDKILEILHLNPKQITYSKWRMPIYRQFDTEQFELVLDEELRRTETQWIDYEEDCIRIKFDIAEYIFDQLMQETLTECFQIVNKRLFLSSNSIRL